MVAAKEALLKYISDALADTDRRLLHAQTKQEAIDLLERLRSEINLAIIELELPDFGSWDLIRRLTILPEKAGETYRHQFTISRILLRND